MFIRVFRTGTSVQLIFFFIVAALLWLDAFLKPVTFVCNEPVYHIFRFLNQGFLSFPKLAVGVAFLCLILQSFIFNHQLVHHDLVPRNTFLPAFIYFVLMSSSPFILTFNPALLANLIGLLILLSILKIYDRQQEPYKLSFISGFLAALAALIYPPAVFYLLMLWLTLLIYRLFEWRNWMIVLCGFITPLLFYAFAFFWVDQLGSLIREYIASFSGFRKPTLNLTTAGWFFWVTLMILILLSILKLAANLNTKVISVRKKYTILLWAMLLPVSTLSFSGNYQSLSLTLSFIGIAGILSYYLSGIKKPLWIEILFIALLVGIVFVKFGF